MAYSLARRQDFSPRCPAGGTWWACGYGTYFAGCCARDPCDITCAQGNLYPAAFDARQYGKFVDATCGTGAKFYTCAAGPTFLGCCKTNACTNGGICPDGDLEPAILNREDQRSAYHATGGTSSMQATATSTSMSMSTSTDATSTADANSLKEHVADKINVPAVAGGAAGGAFALAIVIGLLIYYICHARKSRRGHADSVDQRLSTAGRLGEKDGVVGSPGPPGYYSPNPNEPSSFHPQDAAYFQQSGYHPQQHPQYYHPEPQELPIQPVDGIYDPAARTHRRDPSELSGETALNSPGKPLYTGPQSPQLSDHHGARPSDYHTSQSVDYHTSQPIDYHTSQPIDYHTPQPTEYHTPQPTEFQTTQPIPTQQPEPRSPHDDAAVQTWMAHQSWRPQSTEYLSSDERAQYGSGRRR